MAHLDILFILENMPPSQSVFILEKFLIIVFSDKIQKDRPSFNKICHEKKLVIQFSKYIYQRSFIKTFHAWNYIELYDKKN